MSFILTWLPTAIVFLLMLGILVFVHELGHFMAARLSGIKVKEFAFGFPPTLWSKKVRGTKYMINLFPLGGYVKLLGEDEESQDKDAFCNKRIASRIFVVTAGVIMNFILAYFAFLLLFWCSIPPLTQAPEAYNGNMIEYSGGLFVDEVLPDSLASKNDIKPKDLILQVNEVGDPGVYDLRSEIAKNKDGTVNLVIKRNGDEKIEKTIEIGENDTIGVSLWEKLGRSSYTWWKVPYYAGVETVRIIGMTFAGLYNLLANLFINHTVPDGVAGPVGIFGITSTAVKLGFAYVLGLLILLTVNLGIINILPFPALDGGRLVFLVVEKIRGRKVAENVEGIIHSIGFFLLIALIILITIRDIIRL